MKRRKLLVIASIFAVSCVVTFSYATSMLTQSEMRDTWGADDCQTCTGPGGWDGAPPSCDGTQACSGHTSCPGTLQLRDAPACVGPNVSYDCNWFSSDYVAITRRIFCACTGSPRKCVSGSYAILNVGFALDCFQQSRNSTSC